MSADTKIEWTDATWNPTRGCTKIAQGCKHCYAETFAERFRGVKGHPYEHGFDPRTAPDQLTLPLTWKKPRRIFVDSMSDLFHEAFSFDYIAAVFAVMAASPRHTFQVLTKRTDRALEFFRWMDGTSHFCGEGDRALGRSLPARRIREGVIEVRRHGGEVGWPLVPDGVRWPLPNVWIGTSIAVQKDADESIPHLLKIPAVVRFLSCEPLVGPVSLAAHLPHWQCGQCGTRHHESSIELAEVVCGCGRGAGRWFVKSKGPNALHWVIVGGESGHGARPCNVKWIRSIVEQCKAVGVPVFVKQLGAKVITRNDDGFEGDVGLGGWPDHIATEDRVEYLTAQNWQGDAVRIRLRDRKGGDWNEWPADLRVREFPEVR